MATEQGREKAVWYEDARIVRIHAEKLLTTHFGKRCEGYPRDRPCYCAVCRRWQALGSLLANPHDEPTKGGDAK